MTETSKAVRCPHCGRNVPSPVTPSRDSERGVNGWYNIVVIGPRLHLTPEEEKRVAAAIRRLDAYKANRRQPVADGRIVKTPFGFRVVRACSDASTPA